MSNRVHIICHPYSGDGNGKKVLQKVQKILQGYRLEHITYETDYATHAEVLTEQIITKGYDSYDSHLLVIGGDGTLHEVVNTLILHQQDIPLTYIAAGSGNDFKRTWQKNQSIEDIIRTMLFSRQPTYIPIFQYKESYSDTAGVIVNSMGFGLDAQINALAQQMQGNILSRFGLGSLNYLVSLFGSLPKIKHYSVSGTIDKQPFEIKDCTVASVLNIASMGGGINIDRLTVPHNYEIAVIFYHNIKVRNIFELLYRVFISKDPHVSKNVTRLVGQHLELSVHEPIIGQVDGEVIPEIPAKLDVTLTSYPFYLPEKHSTAKSQV